MSRRMASVVLTIILFSLATAQLPPAQSTLEVATVQVCTVSSIPYGFVIVSRVSTEQCRSNVDLPERDNTWIIKKPAAKELICEKSPYPSNYAVVARTRLNGCPNYGMETENNAWVIARIN